MTARIGSPKTGGRVKGSLDKGERAIVTSQMANDLLLVYRKLGGVKWLLKFAQEQPGEFVRQGLSRLFPAPQKDDPDVLIQQQFNTNLSDRDAAVRIAFALAKGMQDITMTPQQACKIPELPPLVYPEPTEDPDRQQWGESLKLSDEERRDAAIVRETNECKNLEAYHGTAAEQGLSRSQRKRRDELI